MTYRDASGLALTDYPRPSVAVDTAVLTVAPRSEATPGRPALQLQVVLVRRPPVEGEPSWALPGTFLHEGERLADAVARSLADKAGIHGPTRTTQLQVFDDPKRDERGWVLSVAHLAAIQYADLRSELEARSAGAHLASTSRPGPLPFDHKQILAAAVAHLRERYRRAPDPLHLLGPQFTMTELRQVHEAVLGRLLQKDTFRRAMEPRLRGTDQMISGRVGRPSQVFGRTT